MTLFCGGIGKKREFVKTEMSTEAGRIKENTAICDNSRYVRVNKAIQNNGEVNVPIIVDVAVEPVEEEDGYVVINVEEAKLAPLLAKNYEQSVPKVPVKDDGFIIS